jgi:hypothetical protein
MTEEERAVAFELSIAADTAELLLRESYPAFAQSLHAKVGAMKKILEPEK